LVIALSIVVIALIVMILGVALICFWLGKKYLLPFLRPFLSQLMSQLKGGGTATQAKPAKATTAPKSKRLWKLPKWLVPWAMVLLAAFVAFYAIPHWWMAAPRSPRIAPLAVYTLIGIALCFVRWFRKWVLPALLVVVILAIYLKGGWGEAKKQIVDDTYANYNSDPAPCPNFYEQVANGADKNNHFYDDNIDHFDVAMDGTHHCFGAEGEAVIPRTWNYWGVVWVNYQPGDYVGFLPRGRSKPIGPFGAVLPSPNDPAFNGYSGVNYEKLQGKGVLRFYRMW